MTTTLATSSSPGGATWPHALYDLTMAVAAAREPADVFEAALTCLRESLGVERASVLQFDSDGIMRFQAWRGLSDGYRAAVDGHSPWSPATTDAAPVLVEDVAADPSLGELRPTIEGEGIRALAFVPMAIGTKLLGKFMLYYDEPHAFSEGEVLTAQTIAAHVAFAIDQQAHRESERRHQHVLDNLGVAVYTTDAAGRITFYNEEAAELWGRRPEIGVDLWCGSWRMYWPDGTPLPLDECPMAIALKSGKPVRGRDALAERPDGTRVHLIPYPTPVYDASGKMTGAVNVLVDITAQKRAETRLREHEARLVAALEEKEQILAARDDTINLYELVQTQLASLIEASDTLISTRTAEDSVRPILEIATQLLSADGYAVWRFVEDQEQWQIASSRGLSREYIEASAIRDYDGRRQLMQPMVVEDVFAEPELEHLRDRYTRENVASIFVAPLTIGDSHGTLTFYYRDRHEFSDLEVRLGVALANLASASLTASKLFADNESARMALQEANAELERIATDLTIANAAKDEFLSLVSHELKTPLTTIRGNAGILHRMRGQLDDESRNSALADIVGESERLHRIIENLLLLARAEQGRLLDAEPIIVMRTVRKVVERHRQHYPHRPFEIVEHGDPRPVTFSEDCLEQVMENLISNAEKYSPDTAPIMLDFERDTDEVRMRVLDGGMGIGADEAERLFDPFYRSGLATRRAEGLGIGLSVCRRLVEAQGGRMWARPRAEGGSEFGFALPVTEETPTTDPD